MKRWIVLITLLIISSQAGLAAETIQPIVVVVTGSLAAWDAEESPAIVEVIEVDKEEGADTLISELAKLPGIQVNANRLAPGGVNTVSIWGSRSSQVLVLIDGIPLNSARDGLYDLSLIPAGAIDRIEVQKGGSSSLYGSSAIGGVINFITDKGYRPRNDLSLEVGSYGHVETSLKTQGQAGESWFYTLNLRAQGGEGYLKHSAYQAGDLFASVTRDLSDFSSLSVTLLSDRSDLEVPVSAAQQQSHLRLQAKYSYEGVAGDAWDAVLWGDSDDLAYQDQGEYGGIPYTIDSSHGTNAFGYSFRKSWMPEGSAVSVATDGRFDRITSTDLDGRKTLSNLGLYGEAITSLSGSWNRVIAGRVDFHSQFGAHLSPRIGLSHPLFGGEWKANLSSAFKAPNAQDLYWEADGFSAGNPELTPEQAWSAEMQFLGPVRDKLQWSVSSFYRYVDDLIIWSLDETDGVYKAQNIAWSRFLGAEAALEYQVSSSLRLVGEITGIRGEGSQGAAEAYTPLQFSTSIEYSPNERVSGKISLTGAGERPNGLDGYQALDASLNYRLSPEANLNLKVTNILNREYQLIAGYPMPGRQFKAGVLYSF